MSRAKVSGLALADAGFDLRDRGLFLQEVGAAARDQYQVMGKDLPGHKEDSGRQIQVLIGELGKEVARFAPKLDVRRIDEHHFAARHMKVPTDLADLIKRFDFFLVNIPVTLVPAPGAGFSDLECRVRFNPDDPGSKRPVAYEVFPQEQWRDILSLHGSLQVGLDAGLRFKVDPVPLLATLGVPELPVDARVVALAKGSSGFVVGPFTSTLRRQVVLCRGQGNVEVIWQLRGKDVVGREEPRLGIVLKVPKGTARVDIVGAMRVRHDQRFLAGVFRRLLALVKEPTEKFLRAGAPVDDSRLWARVTSEA